MSDNPLARRFVAPVLAVVAVIGVTIGAVAVGRAHHGSAAGPPVLRLIDAGSAAGPAAESAARAGARVAPPGYGGQPTVAGPLPTGPAKARVRTLPAGAAPEPLVRTLAGALGLSGAPQRAAHGWTLPAKGQRLTVADTAGWPWALGLADSISPGSGASGSGGGGQARCHVIAQDAGPLCPGPSGIPIPIPPEHPVAPRGGNAAGPNPGSDTSVGSGVTSSGGRPVPVPLPAPNRPTAAEARAAATPVLSALGLAAAPTHVLRAPGQIQVLADPVVDSWPTVGFATRLAVGTTGTIVDASGWLGPPAAGPEYPLVSAAEALAALPVPEIAVRCQGSICPSPPRITGARLGLALRWDETGRPLLVPAWLYDVDGQDVPLVAIAVDPAYLGAAEPGGKPGPDGGSTGGTGQPGSTGGNQPGSAPPGEPVTPLPSATR
ncbi:MAG TPA: hypothetical protein VLJ59_19760 [Mycobacteriales bacterium]|nr:hypothetical protein [Mycobacteriales bacterium]